MILVFLAQGFEEIEALTCIDILRRGGLEVKSVSIHQDKLVEGAHGIVVQADMLFDEIPLDAQALVLPGGMPGTLHLKAHQGLCTLLLSYANQEDKSIAAICAAPSILGELGILKSKKATCYPGFENQLIAAKVSRRSVVKDGNLITANGPGHAMDFALKLLEHLAGRDQAKAIAHGLNI